MATYGGGINKTHEFLNSQHIGVGSVNSQDNLVYQAPDNTTVELELTALRWVSGTPQTLANANQNFKIVPYDPTTASWDPSFPLRTFPLSFAITLSSPSNLFQMLNAELEGQLFSKTVIKGDKVILQLNPKDRIYFGWLPISSGTLAIIGEVTKFQSSF